VMTTFFSTQQNAQILKSPVSVSNFKSRVSEFLMKSRSRLEILTRSWSRSRRLRSRLHHWCKHTLSAQRRLIKTDKTERFITALVAESHGYRHILNICSLPVTLGITRLFLNWSRPDVLARHVLKRTNTAMSEHSITE